MTDKVQESDIIEAAAEYVWSCVGTGRLTPLSDALPRSKDDDDEHRAFVAAVHRLLVAYRDGGRLTRHRSGDGYEAMRPKFRELGYE